MYWSLRQVLGGGLETGQEGKPGSLLQGLRLLRLREAVGRQNCGLPGSVDYIHGRGAGGPGEGRKLWSRSRKVEGQDEAGQKHSRWKGQHEQRHRDWSP